MIRINLLATSPGASGPREWVPQEQRSALLGLAMLVGSAAAMGGWYLYLHHQRNTLDLKIASAQVDLAKLNEEAKLVEKTAARRAELTERLGLIERLRAAKRQPVSLLETVSQSVPDGLWLLDMKQTGSSVQVDGRAVSLTSVTDFAERLQNSGLFQHPVEILTTNTETLEDTAVVHFSLKAEAVPPPTTTPVVGTSDKTAERRPAATPGSAPSSAAGI